MYKGWLMKPLVQISLPLLFYCVLCFYRLQAVTGCPERILLYSPSLSCSLDLTLNLVLPCIFLFHNDPDSQSTLLQKVTICIFSLNQALIHLLLVQFFSSENLCCTFIQTYTETLVLTLSLLPKLFRLMFSTERHLLLKKCQS